MTGEKHGATTGLCSNYIVMRHLACQEGVAAVTDRGFAQRPAGTGAEANRLDLGIWIMFGTWRDADISDAEVFLHSPRKFVDPHRRIEMNATPNAKFAARPFAQLVDLNGRFFIRMELAQGLYRQRQ